MFVETSARIAELGRQPYTAREFFLKYADRILFGTDGPGTADKLNPQFRFLETRDEHFPYVDDPTRFPPQGFWHIYGIGLPDDVLRKVYFENAARIIPHVAARLASRTERNRDR
jgi:predicted TIM-barrel fold metal-dependent hydrolase